MTTPQTPAVRLHAVASPAEIEAVALAAAHGLDKLLRPQAEGEPSLALDRRQDWTDPPRPGAIVLASMSVHLRAEDGDAAALKAQWLARMDTLRRHGCEDVFLMTVFPSIAKADRRADPDGSTSRLHRIRQLNFLAIELSHETGASIIDVARWFGAIGGRLLQTDYRARGPRACRAMAELVVRTIVYSNIDRCFIAPPQYDGGAALDRLIQQFAALDAPAA